MKTDSEKTLKVFTIGHSNRSFEDFLSILKEFKVCVVADIRRYPGSHKFPHFNREVLHKLLDAEGIKYIWLEQLGGRRHTGKSDNSPNTGLISAGYRNYADHMATGEFHKVVEELLSIATKSPTVVMCAEKFYWKCHRRLLSDHLIARGVEVEHIIESGKLQPHKLTTGAVVTDEGVVCYPPAAAQTRAQQLLNLDGKADKG